MNLIPENRLTLEVLQRAKATQTSVQAVLDEMQAPLPLRDDVMCKCELIERENARLTAEERDRQRLDAEAKKR